MGWLDVILSITYESLTRGIISSPFSLQSSSAPSTTGFEASVASSCVTAAKMISLGWYLVFRTASASIEGAWSSTYAAGLVILILPLASASGEFQLTCTVGQSWAPLMEPSTIVGPTTRADGTWIVLGTYFFKIWSAGRPFP